MLQATYWIFSKSHIVHLMSKTISTIIVLRFFFIVEMCPKIRYSSRQEAIGNFFDHHPVKSKYFGVNCHQKS